MSKPHADSLDLLDGIVAVLEGGNQRRSQRLQAWCKMLELLGFAYALSRDDDTSRIQLSEAARKDLFFEERECSLRVLKAHSLDFLIAKSGLFVWEPKTDVTLAPQVEILSKREREVLYWAKEGKTVEETAIILGISGRTVGKHRQNIYRKTGVRSFFELD